MASQQALSPPPAIRIETENDEAYSPPQQVSSQLQRSNHVRSPVSPAHSRGNSKSSAVSHKDFMSPSSTVVAGSTSPKSYTPSSPGPTVRPPSRLIASASDLNLPDAAGVPMQDGTSPTATPKWHTASEKGCAEQQNLPEVVHPPNQKFAVLPGGARYNPADAPEHNPHATPEWANTDPDASIAEYRKSSQYHETYDRDVQRRTWLRRGLVILALLLAIGLALGLGLGLGLKHKKYSSSTSTLTNSSTSGAQVIDKGGIASTTYLDKSGITLIYYRDANGSLIEQQSKSLKKRDTSSSTSSVTVAAANIHRLSPIAAVSYEYKNVAWKHLFYSDNVGRVQHINSTSSLGNWSEPSPVMASNFTSAILPGSQVAFAAWASTNSSHPQMRCYYGAGQGIAELRLNIASRNPQWTFAGYLPSGNPSAGIGVSVWEQGDYLGLYVRDSANLRVQQMWQGSLKLSDNSYYGPSSDDNNIIVANGSTIVATNNDESADIVYVQDQNNVIQKIRVFQPGSSDMSRYTAIGPAANGTKMSATQLGSGTLLIYQNPNDSGNATLRAVETDLSDNTIFNQTLSA